MVKTLNFYIDDSGSRAPNRKPSTFDPDFNDFFALGGILVNDDDEGRVRKDYASFCNRWGITYPLHSVEIRHTKGKFSWLKRGSEDWERFMGDLSTFLTEIPVLGLACVIDRPGYDARYVEKYGRRQWHLCQTAFAIAVERAAKQAIRTGRKLRVYPERCSKTDDGRLRSYFQLLRQKGCPFDNDLSKKYAPLTSRDFAETLYEIDFKRKSSPMAQLADLYLWPMAKGGYQETYRPYVILREAGRLMDCQLSSSEVEERGIKYSCFELVRDSS